jgi:hypothetical protein
MTVNNFYAACFKNAPLARNEAETEQAFETRQLLRLRRALKILVSVVRFRPWPPYTLGIYIYLFGRHAKSILHQGGVG